MRVTTSAPRAVVGRPRDPQLRGRVLAATREVVAEVGVRAASVSAIAERADCGKPSIYLRWPNLAEVVLDAAAEVSVEDEVLERFASAAAALDALSEVPEGRFLIEALLLPSAVERLGKMRS